MGKAKLPPADDDGPETTSRLYEADGQDLKQLAALLDLKNAEVYRRLCRPVIRAALRAELRRRSGELDRDER